MWDLIVSVPDHCYLFTVLEREMLKVDEKAVIRN